MYEDRPFICRMFGHYEGLKCPNNPKAAVSSDKIARLEFRSYMRPGQYLAGTLGIDIGWPELLGRMKSGVVLARCSQ